MGNQAGAAQAGIAHGHVLTKMVGSDRIAIDDGFWFEFLRVQLPGTEGTGFFDKYYESPTELDELIRNEYFLRLMTTNEHSGNFRTFLRFWTRLLYYYRTSPHDARPCTPAAALSLALICRILVKQFAGMFSAQELIFHLEQVPHEPEKDTTTLQPGELFVSYRNNKLKVNVGSLGQDSVTASAACVEAMVPYVPDDADILRSERCGLRDVAQGDVFAKVDLAGRVALGCHEVVLCPAGVPKKDSVLRALFKEVCDTIVTSSFGALSAASPSLHESDGSDKTEATSGGRNLSVPPHAMQLQCVLLETMLSLLAVVAPRFGPPPEQPVSRLHFCAPFLHANARGSTAAVAQGSATVSSGLHVALPPGSTEEPAMPFLDAFLESLAVEDGTESHSSNAETVGTSTQSRGEAFVATMINFIWLEPYAMRLIKPDIEVLSLLGSTVQKAQAPGGPLPAEAERSDAAAASAWLALRSQIVLLLTLFHRPFAHPAVNGAFAKVTDPSLVVNGQESPVAAGAGAPPNFRELLTTIMSRLHHQLYPLLFYVLLYRNRTFREYCLSQKDVGTLIVPILAVLDQLPTATKAATKTSGGVVLPTSATVLLLALLALTGDPTVCQRASKEVIEDGNKVLRNGPQLTSVPVSSLLVLVLLRLAHWNFAAAKNSFFNKAISGVLANLSRHGLEGLHWHGAERLLERSALLARNHQKWKEDAAISDDAEVKRREMVRELLRSLVRLLSGVLQTTRAKQNCNLIYAIQRQYPPVFSEIEASGDEELCPALKHVRAIVEWFNTECPPVEGEDHRHVSRLEAAAARLPSELDSTSGQYSDVGFAFCETPESWAFFQPSIWRAALLFLPPHICWTTGALQNGRS